jgi:hypothetical protein
MFGLPYLTEAVHWLTLFDSARHGVFMRQVHLGIIFFDVVIGIGSIFIGAGLFFHKEWARKAWLAFSIFTPLVHFNMTFMQLLAGYPLGGLYWIGMVVFVSIISWAYLSKARIKARFH